MTRRRIRRERDADTDVNAIWPRWPPLIPLRRVSAEEDPDPAARIHRAYNGQVRRRHRGQGRRGALAMRRLLWPLRVARFAAGQTRKRGTDVRGGCGKGFLRQWIEQVHLALRRGIPPNAYYLFGLYDDAKRVEAPQYLHRFETKHGGVYARLNHRLGAADGALGDKRRFHERCRAAELAVPPLLLELRDGRVEVVEAPSPALPPRDLVVKPTTGKGGRGVQVWKHVPGTGFRQPNGGETVSTDALLERLCESSRTESLIVQARLVNHKDLADLTQSALSTARIMSCWDEDGIGEPMVAVFRMAVQSDSVDNIHAGGIASPVDLTTGDLGRAVALDPASPRHEVHPRTGSRILGRRLPCWPEALELVRRAHRTFHGHVVAGWDVGLTDDGPVLVEGNAMPCVNLIQRPHDAPLGRTRLGQLVAYHLDAAASRKREAGARHPHAAG